MPEDDLANSCFAFYVRLCHGRHIRFDLDIDVAVVVAAAYFAGCAYRLQRGAQVLGREILIESCQCLIRCGYQGHRHYGDFAAARQALVANLTGSQRVPIVAQSSGASESFSDNGKPVKFRRCPRNGDRVKSPSTAVIRRATASLRVCVGRR